MRCNGSASSLIDRDVPLQRPASESNPEGEEESTTPRLLRLLRAVFYLQVAEVVGLCGISFIHNREHYREFEFSTQFTREISF